MSTQATSTTDFERLVQAAKLRLAERLRAGDDTGVPGALGTIDRLERRIAQRRELARLKELTREP